MAVVGGRNYFGNALYTVKIHVWRVIRIKAEGLCDSAKRCPGK